MSAHSYSLQISLDKPMPEEMYKEIERDIGWDSKCFHLSQEIWIEFGQFYQNDIETYVNVIAAKAEKYGLIANGCAYDLDVAEPDYYVVSDNACGWEGHAVHFIRDLSDEDLISEMKRRGLLADQPKKLIDADLLLQTIHSNCRKLSEESGGHPNFADCFENEAGELSMEVSYVEDLIENAETVNLLK